MPFPYRKIARRLAEGDVALTTEAKGAALEDVVNWIFCSLPGLRVLRHDFTDARGSSEIDLLLMNDRRFTPVPFLSDYVLVECKNWAKRVNSATVRDFIGKLRTSHLDVGILVAANGVTGDAADRTAPNDTIRQVFDREDMKIIVIKRSDLEAFRSQEQIVVFLQQRFAAAILRSSSIT
jgi:hypothetical protein